MGFFSESFVNSFVENGGTEYRAKLLSAAMASVEDFCVSICSLI